MIKWTGLAPLELEFPFPGRLTSTFLADRVRGVRGDDSGLLALGRAQGRQVAVGCCLRHRFHRGVFVSSIILIGRGLCKVTPAMPTRGLYPEEGVGGYLLPEVAEVEGVARRQVVVLLTEGMLWCSGVRFPA